MWLAICAYIAACSGNTSQEAQQSDANQAATDEPEASASPAVSAELARKMEIGEKVYGQYCIACHQADGKGVNGAFPPLIQNEWIEGEELVLVSMVINGIQGPIVVNGEEYNNVMPAHGFLSDEEIASVLTYVRKSFGNDAGEIMVEDVLDIRNRLKEEGSADSL